MRLNGSAMSFRFLSDKLAFAGYRVCKASPGMLRVNCTYVDSNNSKLTNKFAGKQKRIPSGDWGV